MPGATLAPGTAEISLVARALGLRSNALIGAQSSVWQIVKSTGN